MTFIASGAQHVVEDKQLLSSTLLGIPARAVKPLRVLYVHSGNLFGGVETLMLTLVQYQDLSPDMEPHFALCFDGQFSEELLARGAPVHLLGNVRFSRPLTVRRARSNLKDL